MSQPMPMYRQIAAELQRRIEEGELPPGVQLPSELELREQYGEQYGQDGKEISRNTVRDAIQLLVSRGLVETRPGQGTFVLRKVVPFVTRLNVDPDAGGVEDKVYASEVERQGRTPEATLPQVEIQSASDLVARYLELDKGAQVISRHQKRMIDRAPWSMQTTFFPMKDLLGRGAAATRLLEATSLEEGAIQYLRAHLGINQVGWRDTIIARPPNTEERAFFGLSDKVQVAMFEFRRTGYDEDGTPMRFTVTVYPADRNQFELEAGRVPAAEPPAPEPTAERGRAGKRSG
jgi:GntR family transcriptional regulator